MPLSAEQREFVRICAASGWTAREVANELGHGVTRNMVLGHAARNGIQFKHRFNHKLRDEELPPVVEHIPEPEPEPEPPVEIKPYPLQCRYPGCHATKQQNARGYCSKHEADYLNGRGRVRSNMREAGVF